MQTSRVSTAPYVTPGRLEACDTNKRAVLPAHRSKKEDHSLYVCAIVMVPFLSRMPLQLYDLPCGMLEMLGKSYDDLAQRDATATLQATLKRDGSSFVVDLLTRCEDPRHTSRTNTPGEAPVLCYQYCHKHPRGVNAGRHGGDVAAARHDGAHGHAASDAGTGPADAVWHVSNPRVVCHPTPDAKGRCRAPATGHHA